MRIIRTASRSLRARQLAGALLLCLPAAYAGAHQGHHHGQAAHGAAATAPSGTPPVFVASTAKSFTDLMTDAMAVMDDGMLRAPMNGQANHDFITMMLPHHQGAVDMAKAVLLYTTDPGIRNLALGIITEQQNEIHIMQAWLDQHAAQPAR